MAISPSFPSRVATSAPGQLGLFASAALPAGAIVAQFAGPRVAWREVPAEAIRHALLIQDDEWMLPESDARYVNHSCAPNATVDDALAVVTTRAVAADEEITISYDEISMAEWLAAPKAHFWDERWSFDCRCGSPGCVGRVDRYRVRGAEPALTAFTPTKVRVVVVPGKGRGIVATAPIAAGELIERAPVIVSPDREWPHLEKTVLYHYVYTWGPRDVHAAIALGYVSLYNHSYTPNARYENHVEELLIGIVAHRAIAAGEEITINYNSEPSDPAPVWFDVHGS